jgi:hypothetical protein
MGTSMMVFGSLRLRAAEGRISIDGPSAHIEPLQRCLEQHAIGSALWVDPWNVDARLEIRPGASVARVRELLDEWTQ